MQAPIIIPALDLIDGHIVRLHQGDYSKQREYEYTPLAQLQHYEQQGAKIAHLVDLSGAKDPNARQISLIKKLINGVNIPIQIGGGIRHEADIKNLFSVGAARIVIGSTAITSPHDVEAWLSNYGADKFVLALDVRINQAGKKYVAINGWQKDSTLTLEEVIDHFLPFGIKHVLCTDISKDGTLTGSNVALYQEMTQKYPDIFFQASGGIGSLSDVKQLENSGVSGVIIGRSLLENKFTVKEAIKCWQNA